jgi:hypothetical protein
MPATFLFTLNQPQAVAELPLPYESAEVKLLLRHFRDLSSKSDKHLAISVIRRMGRK